MDDDDLFPPAWAFALIVLGVCGLIILLFSLAAKLCGG